jgi:uncharacterized protein involved in response to NO
MPAPRNGPDPAPAAGTDPPGATAHGGTAVIAPAARGWRWLAAAPHRAFFFGGAVGLTLAALWWTLRLFARAGAVPSLGVAVPDPWAHAWLMTFGFLPGFVFGFLFTVFPRWMNATPIGQRVYVGVACGYGAALALAFAGLFAGLGAFALGAGVLAITWGAAWFALLLVLLRAEEPVSHAVVAALALGIGWVAAVACAWGLYRLDGTLVHTALRAGLQACWLPLVYAVCHRMLPFFSQSALPGPALPRPATWLVTFTAAAYAYQALAMYGRFAWLWVPSAVLAAIATLSAVRWRPWASRGVPLLWTLHLAFAWLALALWLQTAQTAGFALTGEWHLGRAPLHALAVGFFASLVVAMATRVTLGHSGRRLVMDTWTVRCFLLVQVAAVLRVASELVPAGASAASALLAASALAFLAGAAGWLLRHAPTYLRPRLDGRPG